MPLIWGFQQDHHRGHHGGCYGCRGGGLSTTFGGEGAEDHYPPSLELEPIHIKMRLGLDLETETLVARVTHTIAANRNGASQLCLNAVDFLDVKVTGSGVQAAYDRKEIAILWDKPFNKGDRREVEISYRVEKPISGLFFMRPTSEDPTKPLYAATDHETERARYWLPCIDLPNVRTTLEFEISAAAHLTALANGYFVKEVANKDGTKTTSWRLDQRCPSYLICFAVGDFTRYDDVDFEGIPVAAFAGREYTTADLQRTFGRTRDMLAWMTKRLGVRFPFPKYYQFALPEFGGAMENISLVSWDDRCMCTAATVGERAWLTDQINVHEMAHSYFGDLVVCRDFAHAWLKESWATYMETCWLEDSKGVDEQHYDLFRNARAYIEEADSRYARPLVTRRFKSSWQMYDRHLYPGGACRLHALRHELGDDVFWPAVTDYLTTYREKVVETDDFRRVLEKHSGKSLQKFFDQWIHRAGYPHIKVTFSYDRDKQVGTFEIEQKQVGDKDDTPPFDISTDLGWTIDGVSETMPVRLDKARQSFNVRMPKDPEQVRFDPGCKVPHKLEFDPGEPRLLKQLTEAQDVVGRIHAAKGLCQSGKRSAMQAVVKAYDREPFWGVRREMLQALAEAHSEDALVGLIAKVATETDPLVLDAVFEAIGAYRDVRVVEAIKARLERDDLPPRAKGAALKALGRQREAAPLSLLMAEGQNQDDPDHHEVQSAALHALGLTRHEDAEPVLRDCVSYGRVRYRARPGAVSGLAELAPFVEKGPRVRIEECLVDLLRDPEPWIRQVAARALKTAGVKSAVEPLAAYRATVPLQEQVIVDDIINAVTKAEDKKVTSLEKQLDELKERYRKLHDRLQDLEDKLR